MFEDHQLFITILSQPVHDLRWGFVVLGILFFFVERESEDQF